MGMQPETAIAPARELSQNPDEVNHLVCCREEWKRAFCGYDIEHEPVNLTSQFICVMCLEAAGQLRPGWQFEEQQICPRDGRPCPEEWEIDARIMRETDRG